MARYPDFFYEDLSYDPCEGCTDYIRGFGNIGNFCNSDGGCSRANLSQDELEELLEMFEVPDK